MTLATHAPQARPPPPRSKVRDYISYSAIKTYQECPLKYFFRYIAGLPDVNAGRIVQRASGPMVGRKVQRQPCLRELVRQA